MCLQEILVLIWSVLLKQTSKLSLFTVLWVIEHSSLSMLSMDLFQVELKWNALGKGT